MSTVDAAIIKALVEHIGMDPDSIPSGGGSTSGGTSDVSLLPTVTKLVHSEDCFVSKDDEGNLTINCRPSIIRGIKLGHVIRLKKTTTDEYVNFVCVQVHLHSQEFIFTFKDLTSTEEHHGFDVKMSASKTSETDATVANYYEVNMDDYETPDEVTTGYMVPERITAITIILENLTETIRRIYNDVLST